MAGRNQKCPSEQAKGLDRHLPRDPHRPNKRLKNTPDPSYFSPFAPSFFWFSPRLRLVFRPPLRPSFLESSVLELSDLSYTPRLCRFPLCWSSSLANSLSSVKTPLSHHDHAPNLYATSSVIECGVPVPSPPNNSTAFYNSTCCYLSKRNDSFATGKTSIINMGESAQRQSSGLGSVWKHLSWALVSHLSYAHIRHYGNAAACLVKALEYVNTDIVFLKIVDRAVYVLCLGESLPSASIIAYLVAYILSSHSYCIIPGLCRPLAASATLRQPPFSSMRSSSSPSP